jgi:hypothetical protein
VPAKTKQEEDARYATFLILTFQSWCMTDGVYDFLTMLRGCILHNSDLGKDSLFCRFMGPNHLEMARQHLKPFKMDILSTTPLDHAMLSLASLKHLCRNGVESVYHGLLVQLVASAYTSPQDGEHLGNSCIT